jgi:CRP/FNR family cyclic AMP-dependent transcriptional regulator
MTLAASPDYGVHTPKKSVTPLPVQGSTLASVGVFSGAPAEVLAALAQHTTVRRFSRRAALAVERTVPTQVFVLLRGRVRGVRRSPAGREVTVEAFQPGDILADALIAPGRPLANDWEAAETSEVAVIERDALAGQLSAWPALALAIAGQISRRHERSKDMAAGLALADVPGRVKATIRSMAEAGETQPDGVLITERPTQQELANTIGACRETVSRVVSELARQGLVSIRGRGMFVSQRLLAGG